MADMPVPEQALAYHEAGHSVAACLAQLRFQNATIIPTEEYLGRCTLETWKDFHPDYRDDHRTVSQAKRRMFVTVAGSIAEEKFTGYPIEDDPHFAQVLQRAGHLNGSQASANLYTQFMWQQTKDYLDLHWECVQAVANVLLEQKTLGYQKIRALIREASGMGTVPTIDLL
jgi:ATP-dependent Zn protease